MKILFNTDAFINGKIYPEGSSIPKEYEKEFEQYLVETESKIVYPIMDGGVKTETAQIPEIPPVQSDKNFKYKSASLSKRSEKNKK